jgi:hypothetical protein
MQRTILQVIKASQSSQTMASFLLPYTNFKDIFPPHTHKYKINTFTLTLTKNLQTAQTQHATRDTNSGRRDGSRRLGMLQLQPGLDQMGHYQLSGLWTR